MIMPARGAECPDQIRRVVIHDVAHAQTARDNPDPASDGHRTSESGTDERDVLLDFACE
jgi:hypothetical protein